MTENGASSNDLHVDEDGEMTQYKKDALSVVSFKIVYSKTDLGSKKTVQFKPAMAHQIFGESEIIFGYRSLAINLFYLHNSSRCYVDIQKSVAKSRDLYEPDDIMKCLKPWLPDDFTTDQTKFEEMLEKEKHDLVFGTVLSEFKDKKECKLFPNGGIYANYKITICNTSDENLKAFHHRFQTFIVWYIDGANLIDLNDERWMIFYVYEEFEHPLTKARICSPVGFCSVYKFFSYPNGVRTRISQFFILPTHQRRGIGSRLYQAVVRKLKEMPEVVDVTVEEPTSTFKKIRDFHDCLAVHEELKESKVDISLISPKKFYELVKKQKICKRQSQRIYDILGCCVVGKSGASLYETYVNSIKHRITGDMEKETRGSKRICNMERASIVVEPADRNAQVEAEFKKYIDDIEPSIKYWRQHLGNK